MSKTTRAEELKFGLQMEQSDEKLRLVQKVIDARCTNVLDLGAGTGFLSREISARGIKCSAVDNDFKVNTYQNTPYLTYYPVDLITFVKNTTEKFDCVILSAVLHELTPKAFRYLQNNLQKIITDDCLLLIREPYYEPKLDGDKVYYRPFRSYAAQQKAIKKIITLTPDAFYNDFKHARKVSGVWVPTPIRILSMSFTYSYGKESWAREKNEYRYTFDIEDLTKFCKKVLGSTCTLCKETFDKDYRRFFRECGYTDDILDGITYTNCLIQAQGW